MPAAYTWISETWTYRLSIHHTKAFSDVPREPGAFHLHWLLSGDLRVTVNGQTLDLEGPCLLPVGSRNWLTDPPGPGEADIRSVVFHPGVLNDAFLQGDVYDHEAFQGTTKSDQYYLHPFLRPPSVYPLALGHVDRLTVLFDQMDHEVTARPDPFWPCRTRSLLLETLILLRLGVKTPPSQTLVDRVLVHLHTRYAETFTLADLASHFATNRTTLALRFREQTGKTLGDYLRSHRLRVAEVLLRDTTLPLVEVVDRVGFSDPSHFGRLFRQQNRMSPSEYRDRHNWILNPAS